MSKKKEVRQRQAEQKQQAQRRRVLIFVVVATAVFILIAVGIYRRTTAPPLDVADVAATNRLGPAGAPVQIVEFGDFGCPSCRAWHASGIKEQLLATYGDQISFTFRHLPVITNQSPLAAEAAQCAAEQDAFWAYHDYLYEVAVGQLSEANLRSHAATLGLDTAAFDECLDSRRYRDYVAADRQAAFSNGARGTPSFYINGEPSGFTYAAMAARIDALLEP